VDIICVVTFDENVGYFAEDQLKSLNTFRNLLLNIIFLLCVKVFKQGFLIIAHEVWHLGYQVEGKIYQFKIGIILINGKELFSLLLNVQSSFR